MPRSTAGEIGFIEDFALAPDRAAVLRQLIPGTQDFYYYHALHALNTEQFEQVNTFTAPWLQRFGQTPLLTEIQSRQALLTYEKDPAKALDSIRRRLALGFVHRQVVPAAETKLPATLDPTLIARATLRAASLARWQNLDNFEDRSLEWLAAEGLGWERRRDLLRRLKQPDVPGLATLIADDLRADHAQDFGSMPIHEQLTLDQLGELVRLRPVLLNHSFLVSAWVRKLHPNNDEDWRRDPASTRAYFDRLLQFVDRLAPVHNGLKAHVLYHRLAFDRAQGVYDRAWFLAYLRLPRQVSYVPHEFLISAVALQFPIDLNANFATLTLLPPVGNDEPLVRDYLKHFLETADTVKEFEPYVEDGYLRRLFAEVKIEHGLGDPEQWASQLPPEEFRALRERVDIDFAATNKTNFRADEPVKLDLFVKNVPTLLVRVFEINTRTYYRTNQHEVNTDVNLDGLIANVEQTHGFAEPPLRRVAKRFDFPELNRPGVYVIDFIGAGKSSRALVRKGRLRPLVATGTAGQVVTVVDDANTPVKDVLLWLGGQEYQANAAGRIIVPFSSNPGRRPIVLSRGDFSCLDAINHEAEVYALTAGIHIERETLLSQKIAPVLVRPGLTLNGTPVSLKLLEDVRLRLTATDQDNIPTTTEIADFRLFEDRESVHEFRVPPRLASLAVTLNAKVKSLSQNKPIDLVAHNSYSVNGIAKTDKIEDLHLTRSGPNFVIEVLGRTGEAKLDRIVQFAVKHRDFKEVVKTSLKTDKDGRLFLGTLPDITSVTATGPEEKSQSWDLPQDRHTYRQLLQVRSGDVVSVPYLGVAMKPERAEFALFELRGDLIRADRFEALAIRNGLLEARGLEPGDYELLLKRTDEKVRVRIVNGPVVNGFVLGTIRHLELPPLPPLQIEKVDVGDDGLSIQLRNVSKFARVHVFATRYRSEFSAFGELNRVRAAQSAAIFPAHAESVYLTGRDIGDEYRYVLDRRGQKKYPGIMLDRPGLLLNPWATRPTDAGEQVAKEGNEFERKALPAPSTVAVPQEDGKAQGQGNGQLPTANSPDLDFLADTAALAVNLVPDEDDVVRVSRKDLGAHSLVQIVAVDPVSTTARTVVLPEPPRKFLDLRLHVGLDPTLHFTQKKQIRVLQPNDPFELADVTSSRFEAYDSLAKVYGLYATLSKDPKLAEFSFVLNWPNLKPAEKREKYSKYACHELHVFLAKKDPAFFKEVVRPYLANKKDKTFIDRWLLDEPLQDDLQPWRYGRLNTAERSMLASRLPGEPARTARDLEDLLRLRPRDTEQLLRLFDTSILRGALGLKDRLEDIGLDPAIPLAYDKPGQSDLSIAGNMAGGFAGRSAATPKGTYLNKSGTTRETTGASPKPQAKREEKAALKKADRDGATKDKDTGEKVTLDELRDDSAFFEKNGEKESVRQLYRQVEPTMEWAENNYYHLLIQNQTPDLVPVGTFWLDYARHDGKTPFLSLHLAEASRNFTEMMLALAVLDLPFEAPKHKTVFEGAKMTFTPAGPIIAFFEEIRPVAGEPGKTPVLVTQDFYRANERFRDENGERLDNFISGEFVVQTVYGCQVVVTNPTSAKQKLSVLFQLPLGAVPVGNGRFTRSVPMDLEPYHTQTLDYFFYFPFPGRFAQFPAHVARDEKFLAAARPVTFEVVAKPSKPDTSSWTYVSQHGTADEVVAFLERENVHALNLDLIAFRLKDKAFFGRVVRLLTSRHLYHPTVWSYGLYHDDPEAAREFLQHQDQFVAEIGGPIKSPLLTVDPVARHLYEHLEYKPLVNARAHALGQRRQIVNDAIHAQYHKLLKVLSYRPRPDDTDRLAVVYYFLLQDRIGEALAKFAEVRRDAVVTKLQYDYCAAYLHLCGEEVEQARLVAGLYADYPVDRWRNAFAVLVSHVDEAEGKGPKVFNADDRNERQGKLAATEPGVEFTLEGRDIKLAFQNLESVRVNYYLMDVEMLFSRNPFVQRVSGPFGSIRPNSTQVVKLPVGKNQFTIPLPDDLIRKNVLVEVVGGPVTRSQPYVASALDVKVLENYGQVRVTDTATGKPAAKLYVKVYARLGGGMVRFHRDGYTDLRGRFDYATVSGPRQEIVSKFAVLVMSEDRGAVLREANPPQQ